MWPRRACPQGCSAVKAESRVEIEVVATHFGHVYLVITFGVDLTDRILVEKVIRNDQALLVRSETEKMRPGVRTEI